MSLSDDWVWAETERLSDVYDDMMMNYDNDMDDDTRGGGGGGLACIGGTGTCRFDDPLFQTPISVL